LAWLRRELSPQRLPHPASSPEAQAAGVQAVTLTTTQGKRLFAQWLVPQHGRKFLGLAVLMHGWGGNGSQLLGAALALQRQGWAVLLPDARSHGQSEADTYSSLPRFAEDIETALDWGLGQMQGRSAAPGNAGTATPVLLLGHSLGAAACILTASRRADVSTVVAVSSFAHPEQVMRRWLAEYRIPFWPLGWLVNRYVERVIGHRFKDIAPLTRVPLVAAPLLLVHGEQDKVVPLTCAEQLQRAAPHGQLLRAAGRHDRFDDEAGLQEQILAWLAQQLPA